jgi:DNA-binding GntR family transcriptional regulator
MKAQTPEQLVWIDTLERNADGAIEAANDLLAALRDGDLESAENAINDLLLNSASSLISFKNLRRQMS